MHKELQKILGFIIYFEVKIFLLQDFQRCKQAMRYYELIEHLLTAASLLIVGAWKQSTLPPLSEWHYKTHYMCFICELTAVSKCRLGNTETNLKCFKQCRLLVSYCTNYRLNSVVPSKILNIVLTDVAYI